MSARAVSRVCVCDTGVCMCKRAVCVCKSATSNALIPSLQKSDSKYENLVSQTKGYMVRAAQASRVRSPEMSMKVSQ